MKAGGIFRIALVFLLLSASIAASEDEDRQEGGRGETPVNTVVREEVVKTVYVPDPETERKLAEALNESGRLMVELALQNTTLQYALADNEALRARVKQQDATMNRLNSEINVLRAYEQRRPTLNESLYMAQYESLESNDTPDASGGIVAQDERPFIVRFLEWLNLM